MDTLDRRRFAVRLEYLLSKGCMTRTELAQVCGVRPSAVSKWMRGANTPSGDAVYRMARYFNCSSDWILGLLPDLPDPILPKGLS